MSISQYKNVSINADISSATPHRLIQMLFEGALTKINQAHGAIDRKEYDVKSSELSKVMAILMELSSALNKEKGGELSENLSELYLYMHGQIMKANASNDVSILAEVSRLLVELKTAWDEIPVSHRTMTGNT